VESSRSFQAGISLWTQLVRQGIEEGVFCDEDPRLLATTAFAIMQVQLACLLEAAAPRSPDRERSPSARRASASPRRPRQLEQE
jgi:hypothetical protein